MRELIFCMAISSILFACNKNEECIDPNEIRIHANVQNVTVTRAPINSTFTADFPIGIYAYNQAWTAGSTNLINNDNATVAGVPNRGKVTFGNGPYYYPADGTTVHFFAFAPQGVETTPATVGTSPIVDINMTGQEDIMFTSSTGSKVGSNPATPPVFSFAHQLTQLQFTFVADIGYPTNNLVTSLTINAQPTKAHMTVASGACTFTGSAAMQALSSSNQTSGISIATTPGTNANSPIMTQNTSPTYLLTVIVKQGNGQPNVTYTNVPITVTPIVGSSHMITMTFSETAITATATVVDWATGSGGSATIL